MKRNTGKGCFNDYLTTEERAKREAEFQRKAGHPVKKPRKTKLKGTCPHCGLIGK